MNTPRKPRPLAEKIAALFSSRRAWAAAILAGLTLLRSQVPALAIISDDQWQQLALLVSAWIVGDSLKDTE